MWDDKKLNDAYDKALKMANAEVAKRVAMSTNTEHGNKGIIFNTYRKLSINNNLRCNYFAAAWQLPT